MQLTGVYTFKVDKQLKKSISTFPTESDFIPVADKSFMFEFNENQATLNFTSGNVYHGEKISRDYYKFNNHISLLVSPDLSARLSRHGYDTMFEEYFIGRLEFKE